MFKKILVANRGEIACRIIRTAKRLGLLTIAVYSTADRDALHVREADEAFFLGPSPAFQSYLSIPALLEVCRKSGAEAVHPGYGFLSERVDFRRALEEEGIVFIGPPCFALEAMGDKITSKKMAQDAGVSTVPGYMGIIETEAEAISLAQKIGYPVMLKASAGGGGKGMRVATNDQEVQEGFARARSEALSAFGDGRLFLEKYIVHPRHIEIQILGDQLGQIIHLGERECSIQRRNQKVIEEAPSPFLDEETRQKMGAQAIALAKAVGYFSAGTVEFIVDQDKNFYFLEMNTRLQVEHPVTELVTGIDLVEEMIKIAQGLPLSFSQQEITHSGWAFESRLYAEDPLRSFLPSTGRLSRYRVPQTSDLSHGVLRNDTGVFEGDHISVYYDPMIAKVSTHGATRASALSAMAEALDLFEIEGVCHNLSFLSSIVDHPVFQSGKLSTSFIAEHFPDGFAAYQATSVKYRDLLFVVAVFLDHQENQRRRQITGQILHSKVSFNRFRIACGGGTKLGITILSDGEGFLCLEREEGGVPLRVESDWRPGMRVFRGKINGIGLYIGVLPCLNGYKLTHKGEELTAFVYTQQEETAHRLMPQKKQARASRFVLCPMPGLVLKICVSMGQEVEVGEPLMVVEAMKMENVVRSERAGKIEALLVKEGESLGVDAVLLAFEGE